MPSSTDTPTPIGPLRVILVSVDGGRADWLAAYMSSGSMPTLAELAEQGASGTVWGVDPASSAVVHNSLASGSPPARTGIVGERVHREEDAFYWYTSAYDLPMGEAEPIWVAAQRAGLTTAVLFWPGASPALSGQLADYTVAYGERDAYSALHVLDFLPAQNWTDAPDSFSPLLESRFEIASQDETWAAVFVLAVDTTDDGETGYDTFILSNGDCVVDDSDAKLQAMPNGWVHWAFDPTQGRGADFLITDSSIEAFTLYQSGIYHITAAPVMLQDALVEHFGFFPPEPDYYALEHGWIDDQQYMDMLRRQSDWMMEVTLWVSETYQPDLLLTVQSPLKQAGHQFLLVDERQPGYSTERAATYADHLTQAAVQVDDALSRLYATTAPDVERGGGLLLVVGSTGMAPIHTQVNLNIALAEAGLLRLGSRGFVVVERTQAIAFTSGGSAHIYINLRGRETEGIVSEEMYREVQDQIVAVLGDLADPVTGELIFARVLRRDELYVLGLDGSHAGDVFAQANPGYYLSDDRAAGTIFEPVVFYGQQGYDARLPEMQGGLVAVGRGVKAGTDLGLLPLIDVAPTIAEWLGFAFTHSGHVIPLLNGE